MSMVHVKYFIASCKKNSISFLIPLIWIIPVITLIFINLISSFGDDYSNYRFINNGKYNYCYNMLKKAEGSFMRINTEVHGKFVPELTVVNVDYYGSHSMGAIYFCDDINILKNSVFSNDNFLEGEIPKDNSTITKYSDGTYPIYISYNAAKKLGSGIGDNIYINIKKSENKNTITSTYNKIGFKIAGIIKPQLYNNDATIYHTCLALVDKDYFNDISKYAVDKTFVKYTKDKLDPSLDMFKQSKSEELNNIIGKYKNIQIIYIFAATALVLSVVTLMEIGFTKHKRAMDTKIFRLLGMKRKNTKTILLLNILLIMLLGIILSALITKLLLIDYIILKYYDWLFIFSFGAIAFLIILIISLVFLVFQKID